MQERILHEPGPEVRPRPAVEDAPGPWSVAADGPEFWRWLFRLYSWAPDITEAHLLKLMTPYEISEELKLICLFTYLF